MQRDGGFRSLDAFGYHAHIGKNFIDVFALAERDTDSSVSAEAAVRRQHKIAKTGQSGQSLRARAEGFAEAKEFGKSACDQCSYCTEFCPRYLLGYEVQPHKVMRSLSFTTTGADIWNQWSELCCACGLCTL